MLHSVNFIKIPFIIIFIQPKERQVLQKSKNAAWKVCIRMIDVLFLNQILLKLKKHGIPVEYNIWKYERNWVQKSHCAL